MIFDVIFFIYFEICRVFSSFGSFNFKLMRVRLNRLIHNLFKFGSVMFFSCLE